MGQAKRNRERGITNSHSRACSQKVNFMDNRLVASLLEKLVSNENRPQVHLGFPTTVEGVASVWMFLGRSLVAPGAFEMPDFAMDTEIGCSYYMGKVTQGTVMEEWSIMLDGPDGSSLDVNYVGRKPDGRIAQEAVNSVLEAFASDAVASEWIDKFIWDRNGHGAIKMKMQIGKPLHPLMLSPNIANGYTPAAK